MTAGLFMLLLVLAALDDAWWVFWVLIITSMGGFLPIS